MEKSVYEHQNKPAEQRLVESVPASISKDTADLAEVCAISNHSGKPLSCYGYSPPDSLENSHSDSRRMAARLCHIRDATTLCHYQHIRAMGYRENQPTAASGS